MTLGFKGGYKFKGARSLDGFTESIQFEERMDVSGSHGELISEVPILLMALDLSNDFANYPAKIEFDKTSVDITHNLGTSNFIIDNLISFKSFVAASLVFIGSPLLAKQNESIPERSQNSKPLAGLLRVQGNYSFKFGFSESEGSNKFAENIDIKHKIDLKPKDFTIDDLHRLKYFLNRALMIAKTIAGIWGANELHFEEGIVEADLGTGTRIFHINDLNGFEFFVSEYNRMSHSLLASTGVKQTVIAQANKELTLGTSLNQENPEMLSLYEYKNGALKRSQTTIPQERTPTCIERCMHYFGLTM